jgi:hypothetical protein
MSFNKHSVSFMLAIALITMLQPAIAEKHATAKKQPEKQQKTQNKPQKNQTEQQPSAIIEFKSNEEAISYAVGASIGRNFKKDGISINPKLFVQGFNDALVGAKLKMSEKEFKSVLASFQSEVRRKMAVNQKEKSLQNQQKAAAFFAENAKKVGVVTHTHQAKRS